MRGQAPATGPWAHMGIASGLAGACLLVLLGLGLNGTDAALAGADADTESGVRRLWQPQIDAQVTSGTGATAGEGVFAGARSIGGTTFAWVNVAGSAQVTVTVRVTTTTSGSVVVHVVGTVPVTVSAPISVSVTNGIYVPDTAQVAGSLYVDRNITVSGPGSAGVAIVDTVGLSGRAQVFNSSGVTQTVSVLGSGPVTGGSNLTATAPEDELTRYLPYTSRDPQPIGYFDDFSSYADGIWPQGNTEYCRVSYTGGRYRIRIDEDWNGSAYKCVVITRVPCFQPIGTIGVSARRSSDKAYPLWYGLYFSAGSNFTRDRWAVEIRPDKVSCDGYTRPYFWLNCLEGGKACFANKYKCTSDIDTDEGDWNDLDITREGSDVTVYINGDKQMEKSHSALKDQGYFNLFAYSQDDDHDVIVEFDDFYAVPEVLDID